MKKLLFLLGAVAVFSCNEKTENKKEAAFN